MGAFRHCVRKMKTELEQKEGLKGCLDSGPLGKVAKSGYDRVIVVSLNELVKAQLELLLVV